MFIFYNFSQFGYFNNNETVIGLNHRTIYTEDKIGLKSLDILGRLILCTVSGVDHFMWHMNVSIVDKYILPYLD